MAASPYRCTVTIDGTKFDAVSAAVQFSTEKDRAGMPQMGSLNTHIRVVADLHDDKNLPFSAVSKFFGFANVVTRDKFKDMKIEYWKDDSKQDALCTYAFKGWISRFETSNPHPIGDDWSAVPAVQNGRFDVRNEVPSAKSVLNHSLIMDLEPIRNQENFAQIKMSN